MDDLRSEIRDAFEKEQATFPPPGALRPSVAREAAVRRNPRPNLQWLAVAVAAVLAALLVISLMSSRLALGPTPGHNRPAPVGDYGPPPAGVPLVYVDDPVNHPWLIGYDWSGKPRGTVKFTPQSVAGLTQVFQSPDGQTFTAGVDAKGGHWQYFDRLGKPIPSQPLPNAYSPVWSADSKHLCAMTFDDQAFDYILWTVVPGGTPHKIGVVAHDPNIGQSSVFVVGCTDDRAILVRTTGNWAAELWEVALSDASVLAHHTYPDFKVANIVVSPDGRYVAESPYQVDIIRAQYVPESAVVRRVSDWAVVATLDLTAVRAFGGDGTRLLTTPSLLLEVQGGAAIVDWSTAGTTSPPASGARLRPRGTVIWRQDRPSLDRLLVEPGGQGFALAFIDPSQRVSPPDTIVIVRGDGSAVRLPGRYAPAW